MFTSEPKTVHDAMKPLVYFNYFAGLGVLRRQNQSRAQYFFMKIHTVIINIFFWTMMYRTLNSLSKVIAFENTSLTALTMYKAIICVNISFAVCAPFLAWLQKKGLEDCVRQMPTLDETFRTVLGARNEYRKTYMSLTYRIMAIISVALFVGISDVPWIFASNQPPLTILAVLVSLHQPIIAMLLLDLNLCSSVGYVGKKLRDINECLLKLTKNASTFHPGKRLFTITRNVVKVTPENKVKNMESEGLMNDKHYLLRQIRKAHLELCKLSRKMNASFGLQNLMSTGVSFVLITGLLYTVYSALSWRSFTISKLRELVPTVIWAAIYASKIWMINHSCWSVSNEANKTGEIIYDLLNSKVDKEFQKEIQEFGVQMLRNPIRFNACGFFTLDYTFVQGAIGSITTYLVILIQIGQVYETPASNTDLVWNATDIQENQ